MKMFMDNDKEYLEDLLVRMAHHSTAIEGNSLTQGETKSIILENYIPRPIDIREVNEVLNYKNLLPYLLEHQKENITISGIQDINRIIMKNIDDRGGKFKIVQNIIAGADFDTTLPFVVPEELKKWTDDLSWRLNHAEKNQDKIDKLILLNPISAPVSEAKNIADFFGNGYYKIGEKLPSKLASKWFSSKMTTLIASEFMIKNRTRSNRKYINNAHLEHFSDYKNIQSLIESYEASSKNSVKEFAPNINNETLIIVGDKDDIAPLKKQLELKKLFKNATFEIINGVGHLTHYETPKEVSKLINNYLSLTKSK